MTKEEIITEIKERLASAKEDLIDSADDIRTPGFNQDLGRHDALRELLEWIEENRAESGNTVCKDTITATLKIIQTQGPQTTRDLVPMIEAFNIPVGGRSKVATLSARLCTSGKGILHLNQERKWCINII